MDQKLFLLINGVWTHPALDRFMAAMSSFDAWLPLLIVAALVALWRGGFRARAFIVVALVTVGISDGVVSNPLKRMTNRPRPGDAMAGVRQVDLGKARPRLLAIFKEPKVRRSKEPAPGPLQGRSFPSSHTSNTMAIATLAALFYRRRGWIFLLAPLLVGYSRVYTGSHWPSDVVGSLFLGAGIGLGCAWAAELVWRRWIGPRFAKERTSLFRLERGA